MKKLFALLFLFSALPLFGQGTSFPVFNRQGWTMAGAVVGTCQGPANPGTATLYCTSPVTTYTDWTLVVPCTQVTTIPNPPGPPLGPVSGVGCTNPGLTDSHGNATIFAANGFYWALVSGYQVVPQTFPFSIGGGGGGGGGNPCGTTYDVQLNISNGFGCDTGIFIETPSNHTTYNNVFSANQQLDVSDSSHTGILDIGHSSGTVVDGHWQLSAANLTPPGYGIDVPPTQPTTTGQLLSIIGSAPVTDPDGVSRWHTQWSSSGGAVSLEYLYPLDYTNAPSPTTSSDLVRTLFPQGTSTAFMGPPPGSGQGPFVYQSNLCTGTGGTASCTFLGPSQAGHAYAAVVLGRSGAVTTGSMTDTAGNTFTNLIGPGSSPVVAYAANVKAATPGIPINTISQTFNASYTWAMIIEEIGDVPAVSPIETYSSTAGTCVGSTLNFSSVTTTATDLIVGFNYVNPGGGPAGDSVYSATSPWFLDQQTSFNTGGLTPWMTIAAVHGLQSPGTITPTATATNCAGNTTTIAFKDGGDTTWASPRFRYPTIMDLVQQGFMPDPAAVTVGYTLGWTGNVNQPFQWQAGAAGDTITSPNSTITVGGTATNTTLDVVGAAGKILAGATPALTYTPALGVDGTSAGTLQLANGSAAFHTTIGTQATANWTFKFPTTAGTSGYVLQTDGSGNTSWTATGGSGANTALSNLASVAINTTLLPASSGSADLGSTSKPFGTAYLLNALSVGSTPPTSCGSATGCLALNEASTAASPAATTDTLRADSTSHRILQSLNGGSEYPTTYTLCSGTITVNPGATSSNTCSSAITTTCTGLATTDTISIDFNADPTATTGYIPGAMGTIVKYPTANTINVKYCNNTGSSITPTSVTLNYKVTR